MCIMGQILQWAFFMSSPLALIQVYGEITIAIWIFRLKKLKPREFTNFPEATQLVGKENKVLWAAPTSSKAPVCKPWTHTTSVHEANRLGQQCLLRSLKDAPTSSHQEVLDLCWKTLMTKLARTQEVRPRYPIRMQQEGGWRVEKN